VELCQNYGVLLTDGLPLTDLQDVQELFYQVQSERTKIWECSFKQRLCGEVSGNYTDKFVLNPMQLAYKRFIAVWLERCKTL